MIQRLVETGRASWSTLPAQAQREMDAVIAGLRTAAKEEHAGAQRMLGRVLLDGHGVKRSDVEAAHWYRKAAAHGDVNAQANLGVMFWEGRGVAQSDAQAVKWYKIAAKQRVAGGAV